LLFIVILVSGCLGIQIVPPGPTPTPEPAPTLAPYPPTDKPYLGRSVTIEVEEIGSATLAVSNAGGSDAYSLMNVWLNVNGRGYLAPTFGEVTWQVGSTAYYAVPADSYITITGEFPDCNAILWSGYAATVTPAPTRTPVYYPTPVPGYSTPVPTEAPDESDYYARSYAWSFNGYDYTWDLTISKSSYNFYRNRPHDQHLHYEMYAMSDYDRTYLDSLVDKLQEASDRDGFSEFDSVMMVIAFVQSLPYTSDEVTTGFDEYPRYPVETLVDNGGDCEDTSILTAALLYEMGYGVVMLGPPGHMAVGVKGGEGIYGTYWEYEGSKYYYLETTGDGWDIGEIPPEYEGLEAEIYTMQQFPDLAISFKSTYVSADDDYVYYKVHCDLSNGGTGIASNVVVYIAALALSQGEDLIWPPDQTLTVGDIEEGGTGWAEATIRVPRGERSQIECVAYGDSFIPVIAMSEIFNN
jgi:hypothetical protein